MLPQVGIQKHVLGMHFVPQWCGIYEKQDVTRFSKGLNMNLDKFTLELYDIGQKIFDLGEFSINQTTTTKTAKETKT